MTALPVTHAMVMAAGLGTRLRPFTELEPKAFLPLMGVPMAQYAVDALAEAGVAEAVLNTHHLAERAAREIDALEPRGVRLLKSDESAELLGSAGGIRKALPLLGGRSFYLLNADVLSGVDLRALALRHAYLRACFGVTITLAVLPCGPRGGRYRELILDGATGLVRGLGEAAADRPFFSGAAVVEPEALVSIPSSGPAEFVPTILEPAIREKRAGFFLSKYAWNDVGDPKLWLEAHLELVDGLETGRIPDRWRRRVETLNKRIAERIWVSKNSTYRIRASEWGDPAYWNAYGDECAAAPSGLGPRAVLYGSAAIVPAEGFRSGIGFCGIWVSD